MRERSPSTPSSTRRAGRLSLLAAAAGAVALLLGGDGAHACNPSPCISASPNPVQLSSTATQGPSTVEWKGPPKSTVWLSVDGGGEAIFANTNSGQKALQVVLGKSYAFRLYRSGQGSKALANLTVTAKRRSITIGRTGNTTVKPLIQAEVVPFGTYAEINATALEPRNITVFISNNQPSTCGGDGLDVVTVGAQGTKNYRTQHSLRVYNLEPTRGYFYLVKMVNQQGKATCVNGSIRTKTRLLDVWINDIRIIDDSDDHSDGDLKFQFFLNPRKQPGYPQVEAGYPTNGARVDAATGAVLDIKPNAHLAARLVPGTVELNVTGNDYDGTGIGGVPFTSTGPLDGHRESSAEDVSGRTVQLSLDPPAPGQEYFVRDFKVRVTGGALEFEAGCRMRVSYL